MICYGSLLPTRIPERLSVNLGLSLEPQTEAVIGNYNKVEQLSCSPEFPLPTQTMGSFPAILVSYYGRQTEEKPGDVKVPQQTMAFRMFPASVPRLWVMVAQFSEKSGPLRPLHQTQRQLLRQLLRPRRCHP